MTGTIWSGFAAVLLLCHSAGATMTKDNRALSLAVTRQGDKIEVQLIGLSPRQQAVSYALEVTGQSSSRHKGRTILAADTRAVLSTMRVSAGQNWCVRLVAEDDGGEPYEVTEGHCAPA
jgi:hypothetical protein